MDPAKLYRIYQESMEAEGLLLRNFDELSPRTQIGWGMFCRTLQREHGLVTDPTITGGKAEEVRLP